MWNRLHSQCIAAGALLSLTLGCRSVSTPVSGPPIARLSVLGVSPEAAVVQADTKDISIFVNYAISSFDESLAPYTVAVQFDRRDGFTVGPAFGSSNAVISKASGQVRLVVTAKQILELHASDDLVVPFTAHVVVDHATTGGTKIIGKSGPIRFPLLAAPRTSPEGLKSTEAPNPALQRTRFARR